jgi:hypothetical protein
VREPEPESLRLRGWEVALAAGVLGLFLALRWPLLTEPGLARGWTSDAGVFGLAGKRIYQHGQIPVFFWGQNYLGTLTSILEAGIGAALMASPLAPGVWTLALRLATMVEVFLGAVFFWLGLRHGFSKAAAALAFVWLAAGPEYLFESSVIARDENVFLCAGVLFWLAARSFDPRLTGQSFDSTAGCLRLGLIAGFSWWMNQGVVFVLAAVGILVLQQTQTYASLRRSLHFRDRFLLRAAPLGWNVSAAALAAARVWSTGLLVWVALGILNELELVSTGFFLFDPLRESLGLWLASQILFEVLWGNREIHRQIWRNARHDLTAGFGRLLAFAGGALVGFSPVILGRFLHWYTVTYGRQSFSIGLGGIVPHLRRVIFEDLWTWIGAGPSLFLRTALAAAVGLLAWRRRRDLAAFFSLRAEAATPIRLAGTVVALCLLFYVFALRLGGPPRYIVEGAPAALGILATAVLSLFSRREGKSVRNAARLAALVLGSLLLASQVRQALALRRRILDQPDPRATVASIREAGYGICYASVWDSYRLQFVGDEAVKFIPYKNRSRNRDESENLIVQPGGKCLLFPDGTFREFLPSDRPIPPQARRQPMS